MSVWLEQDLRAAIQANLPAQVADVLKERIEQLEVKEGRLVAAKRELEQLTEKYGKLEVEAKALLEQNRKLRAKLDDGEELREHNEALARTLELDTVRIEVERQHLCLRVQDLKEVTLAVFANNRYKYSETQERAIAVPGVAAGKDEWGNVVRGEQPYVSKETETKEVEGES